MDIDALSNLHLGKTGPAIQFEVLCWQCTRDVLDGMAQVAWLMDKIAGTLEFASDCAKRVIIKPEAKA